ncbi:MAG TPA: serine/threonine-protein kinase [Polyangia bacterium]|nr:serine/threonine-protein kinase [Polyangia bacterium]
MTWLPDTVLDHLRQVSDIPDLTGTSYEFVRLLGRGGMSAVYLVRDRRLDREVALKVVDVPDGAEPSGELAARLGREARILAHLDHPSIVPIYDVGQLGDGRCYYTMKRVQGQRLDEWVASAPPRPARLRLFQRICEAVAFAHAHGVAHRDLKPPNIMVGRFGEALIMDWGLAKFIAAAPASVASAAPFSGDADVRAAAETVSAGPWPGVGETGAGVLLGTPAYMPPEQIRREAPRLGPQSDVYALGVILYFLLVDRVPFDGSSAGEIFEQVVRGDSKAPRHHDPTIGRPLEAICRKAMARDPAERYATAEALASDMASDLDGLAVSAYQENVLERLGRLLGRHRTLVLLVSAYLTMRLVLLFWARR